MKHFLNEYFDEIYIISLRRRVDRLVKVSKKFFDLGIKFTVVDAVDGSEQEVQKDYQAYVDMPLGGENAHPLELAYRRKMIDSAGAWAYMKTYKKILEEAQDNKLRRILCFDDDVIFHKDFNDLIDKAIRKVPQDWKLLHLGATQHLWDFPSAIKYSDAAIKAYDSSQDYYHPLYTDGSFAVGIDQSVFSTLINEIGKMNCSFDSGPLRKIMQESQDSCVVIQPNLVIADVTESDIRSARDQTKLSQKLKWDLRFYDLKHDYDLVSVIMPCYNAEKTIVPSIESILNQNYPNVEIIIADDGSTDRTVEVIEKNFAENKKIKLIKNEKNRGCYFVRNDALRHSKGQFIAINDTDDYSLADRLNHQLIPFYTQGVSVTIGRILRAHISPEEIKNSSESEIVSLASQRRNHLNKHGDYEYCCRNILGFMTTVYKRSVFDEIGLFWEEKHSMDMEFLERLWLHQKGQVLNEDANSHEMLSNSKYIPDFYAQVDTPVLYSFEMTGKNITHAFKTRKDNNLKALWRARHLNEVEYTFPQWNNANLDLNSNSFKVRQRYLIDKIKEKAHSDRVSSLISQNSRLSESLEELEQQILNLKLTTKSLNEEIEFQNDSHQKDNQKIEWHENEVKHVIKRCHDTIAKTKSYYEDKFFLIKRWKT